MNEYQTEEIDELEFMPRDAFEAGVKYVMKEMMYPFLLSSMCRSCPNCGPSPTAVAIDGIAAGVVWSLFVSPDKRVHFNAPVNQQPPPVGNNVAFISKSLKENEYSFLQGPVRSMAIKYVAASQISAKFK